LKNLIIVESPAKARTIKNFLDDDYEVIASKGHIRDLPKSSFGIKIEDKSFKPEYRVSKDHSKIVKEIKELAKKAETIYIATDEDREGEAIG
jgi:DNA topoisomerase-1